MDEFFGFCSGLRGFVRGVFISVVVGIYRSSGKEELCVRR